MISLLTFLLGLTVYFIGAAVSGTFLLLIGLANSIIMWRIIRKRRQVIIFLSLNAVHTANINQRPKTSKNARKEAKASQKRSSTTPRRTTC